MFSEKQCGTHTEFEPRRTPFCQMAYQTTFIVFLSSMAWKNVVGYDFLINIIFGSCKIINTQLPHLPIPFPSFKLNRLSSN